MSDNDKRAAYDRGEDVTGEGSLVTLHTLLNVMYVCMYVCMYVRAGNNPNGGHEQGFPGNPFAHHFRQCEIIITVCMCFISRIIVFLNTNVCIVDKEDNNFTSSSVRFSPIHFVSESPIS